MAGDDSTQTALLDARHLVAECAISSLPDAVAPHARQSLTQVAARVLAALDQAELGVIVLGIDGLGWDMAAHNWRDSQLSCLTSTFPSISTTAWTTALTGVGVGEHGVVGMVYRLPDHDLIVDAAFARPHRWGTQGASNESDAALGRALTHVVRYQPTLFERATAKGAHCVALARELDTLPGPWARTVLRGARRGCDQARDAAGYAAEAGDPLRLVRTVRADVEATLAAGDARRPILLWVYVNLDQHLHAKGYDNAAAEAVLEIEKIACDWAARGWIVIAHSDHGLVPAVLDPELVKLWDRLDSPAFCRLPSGGAGRTRWLYTLADKTAEVMSALRAGMADKAFIVSREELIGIGVFPDNPAIRERVGEVIAIARGPAFPHLDADAKFDHGALSVAEMLVPLATWADLPADRASRKGEA